MNNEEKYIPEENAPEIDNTPAPVQTETKKLSPKVIGIIAGVAVALVLAIVLIIALLPGGNSTGGSASDVNTDYTVTVVDNNGAPIPGVKLTFTTPAGIPFPGTTDAQGKATYAGDEDGVTVKIISVPRGYEYDKLNTVQNFDENRTLNVTMSVLAPIVINVVDDEGNPVAGVLVQMCDSAGSCRIPTTTDEEGKAYYAYEVGQFNAQLTDGAPEGYTVDDPTAYYPVVDGSVTIVLTKIVK